MSQNPLKGRKITKMVKNFDVHRFSAIFWDFFVISGNSMLGGLFPDVFGVFLANFWALETSQNPLKWSKNSQK